MKFSEACFSLLVETRPKILSFSGGSQRMTEGEFQPMSDPQTKLRNMVLDFFYRQIASGKTNAEIFKKLHSTDLPPVNEVQLNAIRAEFRKKEQQFPEKMKRFRERLGIKQTVIT